MSLPTNLAAPNTFVANTDALAAEVNENFSYAVAEINDTNTEVNLKAAKAGDTYTGTHDMTGATVTVATAAQTTATAQAASTAFVIGQAGTNSPIMDSVAAAGTSSYYARQDHVHPSDTAKLDVTTAAATYASLISPALTGHPTAPTPTVGDNDTSIATTAFVTAAISSLIDSAPGTLDTLNEIAAALGDDPNFAATMTQELALKAPLASPALTGTPTVPTAAADTNSTQAASTAFVIGQAGTTDPVQDDTTAAVGSSLKYARADHRHPINPVIASSVETCTTKALESSASALTASTAATNAETAWYSLDDRYLGAKAADPSVDNDGDALVTGALYFNTGVNEMRVYLGSTWVAAYVPSSDYVRAPGPITDGQVAVFDGDTGTLLKAVNFPEPPMLGVLESTAISSITYNADGSINVITYAANSTGIVTATMGYTSGDLTTIDYKDSGSATLYTATYTYTSGNLTAVTWS